MPFASIWVGVFWRLRSEVRDKSPVCYDTVAEAPLRKNRLFRPAPVELAQDILAQADSHMATLVFCRVEGTENEPFLCLSVSSVVFSTSERPMFTGF